MARMVRCVRPSRPPYMPCGCDLVGSYEPFSSAYSSHPSAEGRMSDQVEILQSMSMQLQSLTSKQNCAVYSIPVHFLINSTQVDREN